MDIESERAAVSVPCHHCLKCEQGAHIPLAVIRREADRQVLARVILGDKLFDRRVLNIVEQKLHYPSLFRVFIQDRLTDIPEVKHREPVLIPVRKRLFPAFRVFMPEPLRVKIVKRLQPLLPADRQVMAARLFRVRSQFA